MAEERPAWLRRMENGTIGESRARSLLIDRFWILDRSVDIHGADLLVQRRITAQNILDRNPPRFGVVQAKYYESLKTRQYIPKSYLLDNDEKPRTEFFVLCYTGVEDKQAVAFLTAQDVVHSFRELPEGYEYAGHFELPGKQVFVEPYLAASPTKVLDTIERNLSHADIIANRRFVLSELGYQSMNPHTDPAFEHPFFNTQGNVHELFTKLKKQAVSAMYDVEEFYEVLCKLVASSNPEEALGLRDRIRDYYHYRVSVKLDDQFIDDAVAYHKVTYQALAGAGRLEAFLHLQQQLEEHLVAFVMPHRVLPKGSTRFLTVRYDPATLELKEISLDIGDIKKENPSPKAKGIQSSVPGEIVAFCCRDFMATSYDPKRRAEVEADIPPEEHVRRESWRLLAPVMNEVFFHLVGKYPGDD